MSRSNPDWGRVLLVGAGPGAADLLTVRALKAIESADVILHDALIGEDILALVPDRVKKIPVGKRGHSASTPQDFTNALMVQLAKQGLRVIRLKGGDPSVFGRSAEERAYLEARGLVVEVVPGITTASAAAAQFGFSLTSRGIGRKVMFATGHTLEGPETAWTDQACENDTTLCLYMAHRNIKDIADALLKGGRNPSTPALIVSSVSRPDAQAFKTDLLGLSAYISKSSDTKPKFIVIGSVCGVAAIKALDQFAAQQEDFRHLPTPLAC